MKKLVKQLLALTLALVIGFTFMPVKAQAGGRKVTIKNSGTVKTVPYKGGRAKKGTFTFSSVGNYYFLKGSTDEGKQVFYKYDVTITLKQPKLSKNDIIKVVKETKKKNYANGYMTFEPVVIDSAGNVIRDIDYSMKLNTDKSSAMKTLVARQGRQSYKMFQWRNVKVYEFSMFVPAERTDVNVGLAGLRNGQLKKSAYSKYMSDKIDYYAAGFGKNKNGFIIAGRVTQ